MMAKMSKTEISAKILKRKTIKVFIIRITPKAFQLTARIRSFLKANMKQIDGEVQALACAIGFWRPSWILLKKLKNAKKKITRQIPQGQYAYCKYLEIIRVGVFET